MIPPSKLSKLLMLLYRIKVYIFSFLTKDHSLKEG